MTDSGNFRLAQEKHKINPKEFKKKFVISSENFHLVCGLEIYVQIFNPLFKEADSNLLYNGILQNN